jgi:hypothetical protein
MADDNKDKKKADIEDYEPGAYTELGEYKGNAMININGGIRPFGFGFRKAELIVEVIDDIKKFVDEQRVVREEKAKKKEEEGK